MSLFTRPPAAPAPDDEPGRNRKDYEAHKERARRRQRTMSQAGRDIGDLPPVADPDRHQTSRRSLQAHLETYHADVFYLPWSQDHALAIRRIEETIHTGGQFALGMPRGSGKSALLEGAAEWALLHGFCRFLVLIGASAAHAEASMENIRTEIESNDLLAADFPEACFPIRQLEGIAQRAHGQLYHGQPSRIEWSKKHLVLPTIPGAASSNACVRVAGITGSMRGMNHKTPDGRLLRPTLVLIDDPQTDKSAASPAQCKRRLSTIQKAVLHLGPPGKRIAVFAALTIIEPHDLADALLDADQSPDWHPQRCCMLPSLPANLALWDKYADTLRDDIRADKGLTRANAFYHKHRDAMDRGALASWPERKNDDELSGIQHAMNLRILNPEAFESECQLNPKTEETDAYRVDAERIAGQLNGYRRLTVPDDAQWITLFVDVHDRLLYWVWAAVRSDFSAWLTYGTFPEQKRRYFTLDQARPTLVDKFGPRRHARAKDKRRQQIDEAIAAGLDAFLAEWMDRDFAAPGEAPSHVDLCLIDAGYRRDLVEAAIRKNPHRRRILPSRGVGITAKKKPFAEYRRQAGDQYGDHWRLPKRSGQRGRLRSMETDTNWWKSQVHRAFDRPVGSPGAWTLPGRSARRHEMFADHLAKSETPTRVYAAEYGRTVDEWEQIPGAQNHWFDGAVGVGVAASKLGAIWPAAADQGPPPDPATPQRGTGKRVRFRYL